MKIIIDKGTQPCTGCGACHGHCPTKAIEMKEDYEGFRQPTIDMDKCINCDMCSKICPVNNDFPNTNETRPEMQATWSKDSDVVESSATGGLFYELAKQVVEEGGVAVGAIYDEDLQVTHEFAETLEDLTKLQGSKYVQSKVYHTFPIIRKMLKEGRTVLFSGTPCQVGGLNAYLKYKKYDNLYTADLICHGIPGAKIYRKYLEELRNAAESEIESINFRDKSNGWNMFSVKVLFENDLQYLQTARDDNFMKIFLSDIALRRSCYDCKFSSIPRAADITLGDYWGIGYRRPHLDNNRGTSQVLVNSDQGRKLLDKIKDRVYVEVTGFEEGLNANPVLVRSVGKPEVRDTIFDGEGPLTTSEIVEEYIYAPYRRRSLMGRFKK